MSGRNIKKPKPTPKPVSKPKPNPSRVRPASNYSAKSAPVLPAEVEVEEIDERVSLLDFPQDPLGFLLSFRWIPEKPDHGKIYWHLNYAFTDKLRAGIDYRAITGDVSLQANYRVMSENNGWRPAMILGTANDDFGDISSQHYSAVFSKRLLEHRGLHLSPYVGGVYIDALDEVRPVAGLHARKGKFSALFSYSGTDEHLTLSYSEGRHTLSFVLFDLDMPGLAWSMNF